MKPVAFRINNEIPDSTRHDNEALWDREGGLPGAFKEFKNRRLPQCSDC